MARKTLKCRRCKRTFSMPAHLARHMSAAHGRVKSTKARKKRARRGNRKTSVRMAPEVLSEGRARVFAAMEVHLRELEAEALSLTGRLQAASAAARALCDIPTLKGR